MYRPHKLGWLDEVIREGRNRGAAPDGSNVAPATMAGVRMLLRHLRKGGCTVILPDQVPGEGEGEWVDFFGRPAYTMTLTGRLQEASRRGTRVLLSPSACPEAGDSGCTFARVRNPFPRTGPPPRAP